MASATPGAVKSALRTLDLIEFVVAHRQGVVASEISASLDIPVSSLSYLLSTLVERGYLARDGRRYVAGPGLDRLRAHRSALTLAERAAPLVRAIRSEIDETTSFMVASGWEVEALVTEASAQALRYAVEPGQKKPLHSLAAGKAILAALPAADLDRYFAETVRDPITPATLSGEVALRADLARTRETGIAEAHEEDTLGISGLACAATIDGRLVGAFAVAVPTVRFTEPLRERIVALLRRSVAALGES
ncbi:IclR family transcriptional regulator [Novosphingobium lentum]|uniref:IclR family transcriptional regulator n=1 Tax=Novosphingobium lentum TaxID=145287 RepID=UPI00082CBA64|nr:IclR family transcriptional regulator C-terminal domain-containing protein [Novosphingobium lentum]